MLPLKSYSTLTLQNLLDTCEDADKIDILNELSIRALWIFSNEQALDYAQAAAHLAARLGDEVRRADALINLGRAHLNSQRYHLVVNHFEQALKIYREHNWGNGLARAYYRFGEYYWVLQNNQLAQTYFTRALEYFAAEGDSKEILRTQISLARVYLADHEYKIALQLFLSVIGEIGYDSTNYHSLLVAVRIAEIYFLQKQYAEAIDYYAKALAILDATRDRAWIKDVLRLMGISFLFLNDTVSARDYFEQSLALSTDQYDKPNRHQIRVHLDYLDALEERHQRQNQQPQEQKAEGAADDSVGREKKILNHSDAFCNANSFGPASLLIANLLARKILS